MRSALVIGLLCIGGLGCNEVRARVTPPSPRIVSQRATDGFAGFDYTYNVSCTVRNEGGDGQVTVTAELGQWKQSRSVRLVADAQEAIDFTFREASLFGRAPKFRCTAD